MILAKHYRVTSMGYGGEGDTFNYKNYSFLVNEPNRGRTDTAKL